MTVKKFFAALIASSLLAHRAAFVQGQLTPIPGVGTTIAGITVKAQVVDENVDMELSIAQDIGWIAISIGPGHGTNIDSIHCSFSTDVQLLDTYSLSSQDHAHQLDTTSNTNLTESENTVTLKRCRFTRPLNNTADTSDAELTTGQPMEVALAYGPGEITTAGPDQSMNYNQHPDGGFGSGNVTIAVADDGNPGPVPEPDLGATAGGKKFGTKYELAYAIVGNNVDIEVAFKGRAGYITLALVDASGGQAHAQNADSIHCSFGDIPSAFDTYQGGNGRAHDVDTANDVIYTLGATSDTLTKCRFTRPITTNDDMSLTTPVTVIIAHGDSTISIDGQAMTYGAHNGGAATERMVIDFNDLQGGTPGAGRAVDKGEDGGGTQNELEGAVPIAYIIGGSAGGLVAVAGIYSMKRRSRTTFPLNAYRGGGGGIQSFGRVGGQGLEWTEMVDPASGNPYYQNKKTREVRWDKPRTFSL